MATKQRNKRAPKAGEPEEVSVGGGGEDAPAPAAAAAATKNGAKAKPLKETTNLTLEEELEAMTKALKKVSLEKEQSEAKLREKEEQLLAQAAEAERVQNLLKSSDEGKKKLEEKLRKLQKVKEFQPTLSLGIPAPGATEDPAKKRKKKDPNRLKRPKSAFLLWCKEHRQTVCEENPNATFAEISGIMGEKWKNVSEEERKPYEERYKVEKDIYLKLVGQEKREAEALKLFHEEQNKKQAQELLEQYLTYKKETEGDDGKKKKKEKDPLKPKHPITAFFAFSNTRRPALLEAKKPIPEIGKILGEEWKALSAAKRAPFEKIAATDKARYAEELESYKKNKAEDRTAAEQEAEEKAKLEKVQALELFKEKEKVDQAKKMMKDQAKEKKKAKGQAKDPNKPKKPLSSYLIFGMEMRKTLAQEQPGMNFMDTNSHIALKWKEISEKDKEAWNKKAAALKVKYEANMEEYRKTNPEPSA